jgi:hypothetical protein
VQSFYARPRYGRRLAVLALCLCLLTACGISAAPAIARAIPSRYLHDQRLPEPVRAWLQALAARPAEPEHVPTPAVTAVAVRLTPPGATVAPTRTVPPSAPPATNTQPPGTAAPSDTPAPANTPTPVPPVPAGGTPTFTPAWVPSGTQAARSTPADLGQATVLLDGIRHVYQGWNNCGPATLSMQLSYFGFTDTQQQIAAVVKPDPEDKNVSPWQLVAYVQSRGFGALLRAGGTLERVRALLDAGYPVIVERGFVPDEHTGWVGHYQLLVGYSTPLQEFVAMDSYLGPNQATSDDALREEWKHFNYTYIVLYPPEQAGQVSAILGTDVDDATMYGGALALAQADIAANQQDPFAWFNLGTNLLALGDAPNAAAAYDQARVLGVPWRMLWYEFGPYEAYLAQGRIDDVITLADSVLSVTENIEEAFYYKGRALLARGDTEGARENFTRALNANPNFTPAADALAALPPP